MENLTTQELTIKQLMAFTMADIDIFLLKDKAQKNDLDKLYTKEEIREQLQKTMNKVLSVIFQGDSGLMDEPIIPALILKHLKDGGFSDRAISELKKIATTK